MEVVEKRHLGVPSELRVVRREDEKAKMERRWQQRYPDISDRTIASNIPARESLVIFTMYTDDDYRKLLEFLRNMIT